MTTPTTLATAAELAASVLREHPDLARVVRVDVGKDDPVNGTVLVTLQMPCAGGVGEIVAAVVGWADALDSTVTLSVHKTYTHITADTVIDGCTVQVWDHLSPVDTAEVFARLGLPEPTFGTHVEISPAALLRTVTPVVAVA